MWKLLRENYSVYLSLSPEEITKLDYKVFQIKTFIETNKQLPKSNRNPLFIYDFSPNNKWNTEGARAWQTV